MQCIKCGKGMSRKNITGLCHSCRRRESRIKYEKKLKLEHRCLSCRKKVAPSILYPEGLKGKKIVKYPVRCFSCRDKENKKRVTKKLLHTFKKEGDL